MQQFLQSKNIRMQLKKFIFSVRCRMLDIASNYPNKYPSKFCPVCRDEESVDTQEHLLICPQLIDGIEIAKEILNYEDLFGNNLEKLIHVGSMIQENYKKSKSFTPVSVLQYCILVGYK